MTNGPESAEAPRRSRRAADAPVDSPAGPRERESQQRARDREALRAYKALADTPERSDSGSAPPTRRQLRLQQQQRAAAAAGRPAEPAASAPAGNSASSSAATKTAAGNSPVRNSAQAAAKPQPAEKTHAPSGSQASAKARPASVTGPAASADAAPLRRERRRRPTSGLAAEVAPGQPGPTVPAVPESVPASRRRDRTEAAGSAAPGKGEAAAKDPNADIAGMTVEQALAAREALEGQARNQVAAMEAMRADDPHAVDLELLAQQKALAERARVLNRRTAAMQKLSRENEERRPSANDPSTAHNLAMVTPLEFVNVPGMDHPVMKAPPTSHVPIVTSSTPTASADAPPARSMPVVPAKAPARRPANQPRRDPAAVAEVRHSRILARADALVNPPLESEEAARPIGARSAFGLDPLDVMTAGLGRTRRLRFAVFGVAGLGTLALIVGVLMIVGGLGG